MRMNPEFDWRTDRWSVAPDHRSGLRRGHLAAWARVLLVALLANSGASFAAETPTTPAPAKPVSRWAEIDAATGAMALDGTLRLSFPLGSAPELKTLGVVAELRHGVETDAHGLARSGWQFRGLQSSLVPVGRERLRWRAFSGESVEFERAKIGRAFSDAGNARWLIREVGGSGHEIRAGDGRTWRFWAGLPVEVEDPALGAFIIVTQGALVREIRRADALPGAPPLLQAAYDVSGRLLVLTVGAAAKQRFAWDAAGQLSSWQRADGQTVRFTYREGLLVSVAEPNRPERALAWAKNPGHARGDSRWVAPVHLAADNGTAYAYTLSVAGFALRRRPPGDGAEVVTVFNPRRRRLEQRSGDVALIVTFRGGTAGRGALEKIETGTGEVLESYRYDARGQLVGITRQGQPERSLAYDETGRVLALEERP